MIARLKRAIVQAIWRVTTPALAAMFEENDELARRNEDLKGLVKDLEDERDQLAQVALSAADLRDALLVGSRPMSNHPLVRGLDAELKKLEKAAA